MNKNLKQKQSFSILDDKLTTKKIEFNLKKNKEQDHTELLDAAAKEFVYEDCQSEYWNPEEYSLLYGTPFWEQASPHEKVLLNQLFWVAYYSQIISAEIATIYFNQTSATGLYAMEDFRTVCDTLDLESSQERAHISAFKIVSEQVEEKLFGERLFTYPMKPFFEETMIFQNTNYMKSLWKRFQLQAYGLLSAGNSFIACQYLTVRGLRTLNGKIVQHKLSQFYSESLDKENAPIPSKISYYHFMDESYHFNSSNLIGTDILKSLKKPTLFESHVANLGIKGTLKDHQNFSASINGIFWYEPALFETIYKLFTGPMFNMKKDDALNMLELCFCKDNQAIHNSFKTQEVARDSYVSYLSNLDFVNQKSKQGGAMNNSSIERYLRTNKSFLRSFKSKKVAA